MHISTLLFLFLLLVFCPFGFTEINIEDHLEKLRSIPYINWSEKNTTSDKSGVVYFNREKAYDGYNMYSNVENKILLTDMEGKIVHTWETGGAARCAWAHVLDDDSILAVQTDHSLLKLDRKSEKIWEYKNSSTHHDIEVLDDGTIVVPTRQIVPYQGRKVYFDSLDFLDSNGKFLERWSTYEHLEEIKKHHPPSELEIENRKIETRMYDYYHMNSVQALPATRLGRYDPRFKEGNLMVCLRNQNLIIILERNTKKIVWSWGVDIFDYPHMPYMLDNGNILVFDNGYHQDFSRILEVNPLAEKVVWTYQADPPQSFYTKYRGSSQRLPNGNTLICESSNGRAFEVDKKGEIVWEFFNPLINEHLKRRRIYRFIRFPKERFRNLPFFKSSK